MSAPIEWLGVVVPAHNEQDYLARCLDSLAVAAARAEVPVEILVVLDACTDDTAAAAGRTPTITIDAGNVGAARRAGFAALRERLPLGVAVECAWLATTDADSHVPPDWLARMVAHADAGWDAVIGTVCVADWAEHWGADAERLRLAWLGSYQATGRHPHVHGANLGFRASHYESVGGIPELALAEDVSLLAAFELAGHAVCRADDLPVVTSARRDARIMNGFSGFLHSLASPTQLDAL